MGDDMRWYLHWLYRMKGDPCIRINLLPSLSITMTDITDKDQGRIINLNVSFNFILHGFEFGFVKNYKVVSGE